MPTVRAALTTDSPGQLTYRRCTFTPPVPDLTDDQRRTSEEHPYEGLPLLNNIMQP